MDLREMLTGLEYLVVGEAGDGQSAVNLARELRPDLVIMDIRMPEMDGIEAARLLTSEDISPVLLLTAYSEPDLVQRATQAGVIGYLVKPFREAQLGPAIDVTLGRFREFRQVRTELGNVKEALDARKSIERAKGLLMERHSVDDRRAFELLRDHSRSGGRRVVDVAQSVLDGHALLPGKSGQ
jgi:two-component system, response regulator PdtaR